MNADSASFRVSKNLTAAALFFSLLASHAIASEDVDFPLEWVTPSLMMPIRHNANRLTWRHGESLTGKLSGYADGLFQWKIDGFQEPLRLKYQSIRELTFETKFTPSKAAFSLTLIDGNHWRWRGSRAMRRTALRL